MAPFQGPSVEFNAGRSVPFAPHCPIPPLPDRHKLGEKFNMTRVCACGKRVSWPRPMLSNALGTPIPPPGPASTHVDAGYLLRPCMGQRPDARHLLSSAMTLVLPARDRPELSAHKSLQRVHDKPIVSAASLHTKTCPHCVHK